MEQYLCDIFVATFLATYTILAILWSNHMAPTSQIREFFGNVDRGAIFLRES